MMKSSPDSHKIRMVSLLLSQPNFRLKDKTATTLSRQCELIKKLIRDAYKDKVPYYFHDIILHIGDNFFQNRHIYRLLTMPPINMNEILSHIHDRRYVITKYDVPYMPIDFPSHYPLGKDLDIICDGFEEYQFVVNSITEDIEKYSDSYIIRKIKKIDKNGNEIRTLIRLEQEDNYLVFQFDIRANLSNNGDEEQLHDLIATRKIKNNFFVPSIQHELLLRFEELYVHPEKKHHLEYINDNKKYIDANLCDKYLSFTWRKQIEV